MVLLPRGGARGDGSRRGETGVPMLLGAGYRYSEPGSRGLLPRDPRSESAAASTTFRAALQRFGRLSASAPWGSPASSPTPLQTRGGRTEPSYRMS